VFAEDRGGLFRQTPKDLGRGLLASARRDIGQHTSGRTEMIGDGDEHVRLTFGRGDRAIDEIEQFGFQV
jgi:hypothetical protein